MTTQIPTSNGAGALPDATALAELANELFRALPGGQAPAAPSRPVSVAAPLPPGGIPPQPQANLLPPATSLPLTPPMKTTHPALAEHVQPPSFITPRLLPTQAQSPDLPTVQATVLPALPKGGGTVAGVPEAPAALAPAGFSAPLATEAAVPQDAVPQGAALPFAGRASIPAVGNYYFLQDAPAVPETGSAVSLDSLAAGWDPLLREAPRVSTPDTPVGTPLATGSRPELSQFGEPPRASGTPVETPNATSTPDVYAAGRTPNAAATPGYANTATGSAPKTASSARSGNAGSVSGNDGAPFASTAPAVPGAFEPSWLLSTPSVAHPPSPAQASGSHYFLDFANPSSARVPAVPVGRGAFDVHAVRRDFPILSERVNGGRPLIWFDNAATTQKPQAVIDRLAHFYAHENSNIHRAAHELAARATDAYESARQTVARFIGAGSPEEIVFVRGTTEAINLVAQTWGKQNVGEGDEIVISHLEHHANIVPWQMLAAEKGAKLRVIPVDDSGQVRLDEYQKLLNDRTKIVSVTQVSNALGTVVPVHDIVQLAHRVGARVLIDGAQSVAHLRVDVRALDADFFVFSGHKIFGPTGIGVVYGKREVLQHTPPYQGGGNMIEDVTFDKTVYQDPPARFEAGTGNIADAAGLAAALDYVERIGLENIARYEHELLEYGLQELCTIPGLHLIGTAHEKTSVMSFVLDGYTTQQVGQALSEEGIAVRSGHHCAQPILRRFGLESTVRPSLAFYNTFEEIDTLVRQVRRLADRR